MKRFLWFLSTGLAIILVLFACDTGVTPSADSNTDVDDTALPFGPELHVS